MPLSPHLRSSDEFSHLTWRNVAKQRRKAVYRLYVVPPGEVHRQQLVKQMADDRACDVASDGVPIGGTRPAGSGTPEVPMSDLWLVDDRAVVKQEPVADGEPVWVVSTREDDLHAARQLWERLWRQQQHQASSSATTAWSLTDPLLESAQMVRVLAKMSCTRNHVDRSSCEWYHGVWQYLRLFNMVSSPGWHLRFYRDWLRREINAARTCRILISGAADYSMLAFVLEAADDRSGLEVHILDECRTPLIACQWYAKRFGLKVFTHNMDILAPIDELTHELCGAADDRRAFDVIVTDAFLTRFCPDDAATVLNTWSALLRTGGAVVTTVRLHPRNNPRRPLSPGSTTAPPTRLNRDVLDYALRLRSRAASWRWMLGIELEELLDAARTYALRMTSRTLGDLTQVRALFENAGLNVAYDETGRVDGELCPTEYARFVARKGRR